MKAAVCYEIGKPLVVEEVNIDAPRQGEVKVKLVALYKAGVLKLDELITACYPLDDINKAIELVEKGEALRNVITFE